MNHPRNSNLTKIKPHNSVYLRNYKFSSKNHAFSKKNRWRNFTFIWNFFLLTQCFLVNSLSADSMFFLSRKYIVWVIWKITKNLTAGGWQWSLARVVWWRPRASNSIRIVRSSSVFLSSENHLAPSIQSRRQGKKWRSRNQNWVEMLILSQMTIPQTISKTVLSILSYLSISIAIYWKLNNSENWMNSE